jgi:hypothetical protein
MARALAGMRLAGLDGPHNGDNGPIVKVGRRGWYPPGPWTQED